MSMRAAKPDAKTRQLAMVELERRRRQRIKTLVSERIQRIYGSYTTYINTLRRYKMSDDQRLNFERAGVILQPKQIEFAVAARNADHVGNPNEIGMGGARGGSKSFALFAQVCLDDCQRYPGLKVLYLRKTAKASKEQLDDLYKNILANVDCEKTTEAVKFPNGSRIVIGGFKDDATALTYQGIEYDILIVEEATQLLERTYKTLRLSVRSSKKGWRPRTYASTNPLGVGHMWFKKRFIDTARSKKTGDTTFIFATVDDNVMVNPEYVANLDDLTGAEYRAYRLGDWDVSAGAFFEAWSYDRHVVAPFQGELPRDWRYWLSMDIGYNHWNMTYLHAKTGDGIVYTLSELGHRKKQPTEIAPDVVKMLQRYNLTINDLDCVLAGSDAFMKTAASALSVSQQYAQLGISINPAETSPGSRIARAQHLATLLGNAEREIPPQWFVTSDCHRLIDCIPYLERDPSNSEDVLKVDCDNNGDGGDDPYDALCYGLYRPHVSSASVGRVGRRHAT